jgi:hypothetical protein
MRQLQLLAACSAATILTALVVPGGTASASTPSHGRLLATVDPSVHPMAANRSAVPVSLPVAATPGRVCTPTPPDSPERRAGGTLLCVGPADAASSSRAASTTTDSAAASTTTDGASASPMASSLCAGIPTGTINIDRFGSCMKLAISGVLYAEDDGTPLGTATLVMVDSITLNATSSTFTDQVTVTLSSVSGQVSAVNVALDAACTALCRTTASTPWAGSRLLAPGQSASGTFAFSETLAKGVQDSTLVKYHAYVTVPGAAPAQPNASWDGSTYIRCDNAVGSTSGCVYPKASPQFGLSLSAYGAAAVTYYWAQTYLPDGWGFTRPLHRLADTSLADANRARTCDSTFVKVSAVANDSCDEFPFAKTYEGGAQGKQCADVVPLLEGGTWHLYEANPNKPVTMLESCVRGHVPLSQNEGAGGELGRFTQAQRVLDYDAYLTYTYD